ncbi:hypothetical protein ACFLWN_00035 [Chloroflexota bacterium]
MEMVGTDNIQKALSLVDRMVSLAGAECRRLKAQIVKAAQGDGAAFAGVVFFPRDCHVFDERNLALLREIIFLMLHKYGNEASDS